jgi:hypothetical protein
LERIVRQRNQERDGLALDPHCTEKGVIGRASLPPDTRASYGSSTTRVFYWGT